MKEVTQESHNKLVVESIKKYMEVYKRKAGQVNSNLKIVDVIYRLMNDACGIGTREQKHRLSKLYYRLIRQDRLICTPNANTPLFKGSTKFEQFHVDSNEQVTSYIDYYQTTPIYSVNTIKQLINAGTMPNTKKVELNKLAYGVDFELNGSGRLIISLPKIKVITTIRDVLDNDVTDQFDLSTINNNFVIISKNIFTQGNMFLKLK